MKTIASILFVALFTLTATAQKKQESKERLSPGQMATLQTKKMALALDLNENQQKEILKINKEQAEKRRKKMEAYKSMKEKNERLSSEERYKLMNAQLDERLAIQEQMKRILNEDQYAQWRKMSAMKHKKRKHARKRASDKS